MNEAREINYRTKAAYELVSSVPCPRSVSETYSLGISLQYCIRAKYLELEEANQGSQKILYRNLSLRELDGKTAIEKLDEADLNQALGYFYTHGGPVIEPPVSEQLAKEIQPFFNRIVDNFLSELDVLVKMTSRGNMSATELEAAINNNITGMYSTLSRLFQTAELEPAFKALIDVRRSM